MKKRHRHPNRQQRVADQIMRELALLIQREIKDPRVKQITLTDTTVSSDYGYAKVYFTTLKTECLDSILDGLKSSAGYLRSHLGQRIKLHQIPRLEFLYDISIERGAYLSQLIDQAVASIAPENECVSDSDAPLLQNQIIGTQ